MLSSPRLLLDLAQLRRLEGDHRALPLMERAGAAAADVAEGMIGSQDAPVVIFAGPGNNGGDALVAARLLHARGLNVHVVGHAEKSQWSGEAALAFKQFADAGLELRSAPPETACLLVDGIFGIGLSRAPAEPWRTLIDNLNAMAQSCRCPVLALDCPSGLDAATGSAFAPAVLADRTITFLANKPGLHTADGPDHAGEVLVDHLGLDLAGWITADGRANPGNAPGRLVHPEDFRAHLRPRRRNTHKGSYGAAGILGGASSMVGAALLAARAALKLGCGRVYAGLLDPHAPRVDLLQPELMLRSPDALFDAPLTAVAVGPGLGTSREAADLILRAISIPLPLAIDADGLTLLGSMDDGPTLLVGRTAPTVLTPHPAEASRLLDIAIAEVQADSVASALAMAERYRALVVLKGCGSVLASPDGRWWINPTGSPALATAGTGDVLTGLIVALLAQGWPPADALLASVFLHGRGAERWITESGLPSGMTASELIDACRQEFGLWTTQTPPARAM